MATILEHVHASPQEFWSRFVQPRVAHIQNVSPLNSTNIIRDACQTLDDELDALHLAMCQLRKRRNALSIVSCLPPEVLAHVFEFVALAMTPSKYNSSRLDRLGWIVVTYVCTHWRDTALMHPSLWGNIHSGLSPRWRDAMIARAKSAPLSIHLGYYRLSDDFVRQHIFHTRELRLSGLWKNDLILQLSTPPAPILEHLSLQGSEDAAMVLPVDIFAGNTPSLRHINLDGLLLPWSASIFRNLTYLRVNLSRFGAPLPLPPGSNTISQHEHLIGALARMPALQMLDLAYCFTLSSHSQHPVGHGLTVLPCLEVLSLAGTLTECIGVTRHLRIPSSSRVVLKCPGAPQQTDLGLAHFLETYLSGGACPDLLTLSISLSGHHSVQSELVTVKLWRTCSPSDAHRPDFCPVQEPFISISVPPSPDSLDSLRNLCSVLPLEDLRVLHVAYDHDSWSSEAWINIFGRCELVEHVYVQGRNVVHFCRALVCSASRADETATSAEELFFRHLKSLEVCKIDLLASVENEGDECPFNELLNDWLSMRMDLIIIDDLEDADDDADDDEDYGDKSQDGGQAEQISEDSRLEQLVIAQCSITQEHVEALEDYVQDVSWDEDKGVYEESEESSENVEEDMGGYYIFH